MNTTSAVREGYIPFRDWRNWCSTRLPRGAGSHGGHRSTVIFYEKLGCVNSSLPEPAPDLWTVGLHLDEIDASADSWVWTGCNLLGQSRGGMLAMEYALTRPPGVGEFDRCQLTCQHGWLKRTDFGQHCRRVSSKRSWRTKPPEPQIHRHTKRR